jgi:predicted nucleotide-binding protein
MNQLSQAEEMQMATILVVDNDPDQRENLAWTARGRGGRHIVTAQSAEGAILSIRERDFDLIVTDLVMETKRAGLQVLEAAKEKSVDTQVILCTGLGAANVCSDAMHLGAFDFLDINSETIDFWAMLRTKIDLALQFREGRISKPSSSAGRSKTVFIVHGHDEVSKFELKDFLTNLGLDPVVLHQQDDLGKTIIEKFEHYAKKAAFAFVLMTPDDQSEVASSEERKWRARQNVIMELGWFMANLRRENVAILYKGELEIPSDILGLLHLPFKSSVSEISEKIRQRLAGVGLINR